MRPLIHISLTSVSNESRIFKECEAAHSTGLFSSVIVLGKSGKGLADSEEHPFFTVRRRRSSTAGDGKLQRLLVAFAWFRWVWQACILERPSVIQIHSVLLLPIGYFIKRRLKCKLVYDCHELETEASGIFGWRKAVFKALERNFIAKCDEVLVVGKLIGKWYEDEYGRRPRLVRNFPIPIEQGRAQAGNDIRNRFSIPEDHVLLMYQGGFFDGRLIPEIIAAIETGRDDWSLVFLGYGELEGTILGAQIRCNRIHMHEAVPSKDLLTYTQQCDIGFIGVEDTCLSHRYCMPNKFFECLAAGVPVMSPELPELSAIVNEYGCGWVFRSEVSALVELIAGISADDIITKKTAVGRIDPPFTWDREQEELIRIYGELVSAFRQPSLNG